MLIKKQCDGCDAEIFSAFFLAQCSKCGKHKDLCADCVSEVTCECGGTFFRSEPLKKGDYIEDVYGNKIKLENHLLY